MAKLGFKLFVGTQSPHFLLHLPVHRPYNMESQSSPSSAWDQIDLNKAASCGSNLNVTFSARTRQLNSLGLYLTFEIIRSSEDGPGKLSCKSQMTDKMQHWELDSATVWWWHGPWEADFARGVTLVLLTAIGGRKPKIPGTESQWFFFKQAINSHNFQDRQLFPCPLKKAFRNAVQLKPICYLLGMQSGKTWSLLLGGLQGRPAGCSVCSERSPTSCWQPAKQSRSA